MKKFMGVILLTLLVCEAATEARGFATEVNVGTKEAQGIIVEKVAFRPRRLLPSPPKPIIIEKTVHVDPPPWPKQEPKTIVVEKVAFRPRGLPPKPIIIAKRIMNIEVIIEPSRPPKIEPKIINVDLPMFKSFPKWQVPEPIVKERPVVNESPSHPPIQENTQQKCSRQHGPKI